MAYAILAGMPPVYGLYTATVPMYIYGMLGTSRQLSIGPFAITSLLLGTAVQAFGYPDGSPEYILIASNITMLVGLILYLLGALRMGELTNFLSQSVLTGFLTASASVILLSQCRYILGIKAPRMQYSHQTIIYLLTHLPETNGFSVLVGVSSFAALYGVKMWRQKNKLTDKASSLFRIIYLSTNAASIITILLGAGIAYAIATSSLNPRYHLQVVGKVPAGLKAPNFEMLEFQKVISLVPTSLVLAIISFTGNWAVAKRYAAINGYSVDATQELIATGMTNIFGALFNSFVSSGGLARSAVNAESGAKSPLSGCIAATLMILALLFFTPYFYYIPMCTLGAIIQVSVISMLDFPTMMETYRVDKRDCAVMVLTFLCTFFIGIQQGMFLGVVLSIGNVLRASAFPQIVHLGRVGNTVNYKDVFRNPDATQIPGIGIVRMDAALYFANCVHFKEVSVSEKLKVTGEDDLVQKFSVRTHAFFVSIACTVSCLWTIN
jgi:SulP family sulfate permease